MPSTQAAIAVEWHVRASTPTDAVDTTIESLQEYDRAGVIDDLIVQSWPDEAALIDDAWRADAVERFERFQAWADRHGGHLCPSFAIREQTSLVDDSTPTLVLPAR